MTFQEYLTEAAEYHRKASGAGNCRLGQAYMNSLPDKYYKLITGTELDCFYNDSLIPVTLTWLAIHWKTD